MKTISVAGLPITVFEQSNVEDEIIKCFNNDHCVSFHGYSIDTLQLMKRIPNLYQMRMVNDYFLCDGRGFYYFMRLLGVKRVSKLSLPALTMMLVNIAARNKKSIFILGATEESNKTALGVLTNRYGVANVSGRDGYFNEADEQSITDLINDQTPDILFLGMSSPKKDEFIYRWKSILRVKIIVHCGGMVDVISGKTKIYPNWVKNLCLAGLFRFIQEPIRLRRDFINAVYGLVLALKFLFKKQSYSEAVLLKKE